MDREVTLKLGVGAACVIVLGFVIHAVVMGVTFEALHQPKGGINVPRVERPVMDGYKAGDMPSPVINIQARDEKKQQGAQAMPPCIPCQNQQYDAPQIVYEGGIFRPRRPVQPIAPQPARPNPYQPQPQPVSPAPQPSVTPPVGSKPNSKYQLALFVSYNNRSNEVARWFDNNANLAKLKSNCQFQVYTDKSPMYLQRFSGVVPVDAFPVVMFLRPDGGHIHIAGGQDIPATAEELYRDLRQGWMYAEDLKRNQMAEAPPYCPDGNCPLPSVEPEEREPRFPLLRPFKDRNSEKDVEGWVLDWWWGGKQINAALIVIVVMGVMIVVAAVMRARS